MSKQAYMRVENIVKKFGPFTALNGVDLEVHAGRSARALGG
jgi:simple sugar transport system ATP-binding protein